MNFLTDHIRAAAKARFPAAPPTSRLRTDLLCSMPMCFNLFGELWNRPAEATQALSTWLPDLPGEVREVRFEWSPGRQHPDFLGDNTAFDASFHLDLEAGESGIVGIETKYHEWASPEDLPTPDKLERYEQVAERSGVFHPKWRDRILEGPLQQIWRDHLLLLSMLQHPSRAWGWGRYVLVYPSRNASFRSAIHKYRGVLAQPETFVPLTVEQLLDAHVLPTDVEEAFRDRYLW